MSDFLASPSFKLLAGLLIGAVWVFHGLYSKLLNRIPRHERIVGRVLGERWARPATKCIGLGEVVLGVWTFSGWQPVGCAIVQTAALVSMNVLEIARARDLLISGVGMALLNAAFLALVWWWATVGSR